MAQEKIIQTAGRDQLGAFAPKFAELNDDVLFGEVWSRTDQLGLRDRSLVTITSLISQGITDSSLTYHLQSAKNNGITRTEIAEILTHIGFYAGWPKAWAAFRLAKEVWADDSAAADAKANFQRQMIFPIGEPNTAYAQYFIVTPRVIQIGSIDFHIETVKPHQFIGISVQKRAIGLEVNNPVVHKHMPVKFQETCTGQAFTHFLHLRVGERYPYFTHFARGEKAIDKLDISAQESHVAKPR